MKRKVKAVVPSRTTKRTPKIFSTVREALSYFFSEPKGHKEYLKGTDRGTQAADRVFTEVSTTRS
jgi:hypothetical protein